MQRGVHSLKKRFLPFALQEISSSELIHKAFPKIRTVFSRSYSKAVSAAEIHFGQPVHETHPHLLKSGECKLGKPSRASRMMLILDIEQ